eukprot:491105-Hanusia_phi.AAC.2
MTCNTSLPPSPELAPGTARCRSSPARRIRTPRRVSRRSRRRLRPDLRPKDLQLKRTYEAQITLQPGAKPVTARPYRIPLQLGRRRSFAVPSNTWNVSFIPSSMATNVVGELGCHDPSVCTPTIVRHSVTQ